MAREKRPTGLYNMLRNYHNPHEQVVIMTDLTEEQCIAHCKGTENKSSTCTTEEGKAATALRGEWFDGYTWQYK